MITNYVQVVPTDIHKCNSSPSGNHCFCGVIINPEWNSPENPPNWCCWCGQNRDSLHGHFKNKHYTTTITTITTFPQTGSSGFKDYDHRPYWEWVPNTWINPPLEYTNIQLQTIGEPPNISINNKEGMLDVDILYWLTNWNHDKGSTSPKPKKKRVTKKKVAAKKKKPR